MNAEQFIKSTKSIACVKNKYFKHIEFNGVTVYLYIKGNDFMFNITKLFKELNAHTKTASSGASSFVRKNLIEKGWLERYPNKFMDVEGKGTQEFKGMYVSIDMFQEWLVPIASLSAYRWFINDDAWYETLGRGYVYIIQTPQHSKSKVFKYGHTVNLMERFKVYLNKRPVKQQRIGIDVIAFCYVENQSQAENAIAEEFDKFKFESTEDGREFRLINNEDYDYEQARGLVADIFQAAMIEIGMNIEAIQWFDTDANTFKYKGDI